MLSPSITLLQEPTTLASRSAEYARERRFSESAAYLQAVFNVLGELQLTMAQAKTVRSIREFCEDQTELLGPSYGLVFQGYTVHEVDGQASVEAHELMFGEPIGVYRWLVDCDGSKVSF